MSTKKVNREFTGMVLRDARVEARSMGLGDAIKGLTTWRDNTGRNPYFQVFKGREVVWSGTAYNANDAKTKYIYKLMSENEKISDRRKKLLTIFSEWRMLSTMRSQNYKPTSHPHKQSSPGGEGSTRPVSYQKGEF